MGGLKIPNSQKKPKKRWRIGGVALRNKTVKSKDPVSKDHGDDHTENPTPESSLNSIDVDSNGSHEEEEDHHNNLADLPPTMSEVDDSDSDDEDLYLENSGDLRSSFPEAAPTRSDDDEDDHTPQTRNHQYRDDGFSSDSSFEEDMKRHKMMRRNSPAWSKELSKIAEDSDEVDNSNSYDDKYSTSPFDDVKKSNSFEEAYNNNNPFDDDDDDADNTRKNTRDIAFEYEQQIEEPVQQKLAALKVAPISQPAVEEGSPTDEEDEKVELPTHKELSKTLCKIVATEHYSGRESLLALEQLSKWAHTQESNLLKHFLTYGGVVKVIDYLDEQIDVAGKKPSRAGDFLLEAIHKTADVICNVCFVGKHGINEDIAIVNATVVVKYGGIETLLRASDAYNRSHAKDDPIALKAVEGVWNAIMNVYCNAEAAVTKEISNMVVDAAIQTMSATGDIDHAIATETLANVFNSLYRITYHGFVTQEEFQDKNLLNHCLDVFKRDVTTSSDGDEELLEEAISFLYGCHEKDLLRKGSDYESVLPLCVMGLREFAFDNENIREWASKLLDGACSNIDNKASIMMAEGAIEAIAPFLTFEDVTPDDKEFMRNLIRKIVAPV